jgi:predicted ATPase
MGTSFHRPILCPALVGRSSDLTMLGNLLEQAQHGEGQVVLLSGEAGIGKSRLLNEVRQLATRLGFLLVSGNCLPHDLTCPYAPLFDLLQTLRATSSQAAFVENIRPFVRELSPLLPDDLQFQTNFPALHPLPYLDPEQVKLHLFSALTRFFQKTTSTRPLFLSIEDLGWCDELSLEFLYYLARQCSAQPLFLLLTYRSDEISFALQRWLSLLEHERLALEIPLASLSRSQIDEMLQALLACSTSGRADLLTLIDEMAEGNPFFVEEILTALVATGELRCAENGLWEFKLLRERCVPQSVLDAVRLRTSVLNEPVRQMLALITVIGRRFDFALLKILTASGEAELLSLMKELVAAQLIVEESADRFAFRHALIQQAMYVQLLACERKQLHGRIAEAMERHAVPLLDTYLADISLHCYEAGMWAKSLAYARQAGERALALHDPEAAVAYFSRALLAAQSLAQEPLSTLYRARGLAYEILGKPDLARADYTQALVVARNARSCSSRRQEKQAFDGLTFREREVAILIAQGKYNREIAEDLMVSGRTIETHVGNIMFKLGFSSRRQIAAWAREKGLFR